MPPLELAGGRSDKVRKIKHPRHFGMRGFMFRKRRTGAKGMRRSAIVRAKIFTRRRTMWRVIEHDYRICALNLSMQESTSKSIISRKPKGYYKQGISHCGAFAVKAILEAYGKDDGREPRDYHPTFFGKMTGLTLGFDYWPPVLRSFGISAQAHKADNLNPDEKIQLLKNLLSKNNPVMLRIGNGY